MNTITLTVPEEVALRLAQDPVLLQEAAALVTDAYAQPGPEAIEAVKRGLAQYHAGESLSLEESRKQGEARLEEYLAQRRAKNGA